MTTQVCLSGTEPKRPNIAMSRVDTTDLDHAMRLIAQLIDRGGEAYWPIMDRLAQEKSKIDARRKQLDFYLSRRVADPASSISIKI